MRAPGLPDDIMQIGGTGRKEDATYNPAPPEHVARCLEDVMAWLRNKTLIEMGDAGMGMGLPVRMAIGHAHFEAVHPFSNGNGRIGRILWPLQMTAAGHLPLYLSGYVEKNRDEYGQALQEAQKKLSYGRIVEFVANAVIETTSDYEDAHCHCQNSGGSTGCFLSGSLKRAECARKQACRPGADRLWPQPHLRY